MITIEQAGDFLDEIATELPADFYKYLNGGISLSPEVKAHPESVGKNLFILGEYHHDRNLGRFIMIYFGSFQIVYGHLQPEDARQELKRILVHEFTHHLESLAGERDLEIEDAIQMAKYKRRYTSS